MAVCGAVCLVAVAVRAEGLLGAGVGGRRAQIAERIEDGRLRLAVVLDAEAELVLVALVAGVGRAQLAGLAVSGQV